MPPLPAPLLDTIELPSDLQRLPKIPVTISEKMGFLCRPARRQIRRPRVAIPGE